MNVHSGSVYLLGAGEEGDYYRTELESVERAGPLLLPRYSLDTGRPVVEAERGGARGGARCGLGFWHQVLRHYHGPASRDKQNEERRRGGPGPFLGLG